MEARLLGLASDMRASGLSERGKSPQASGIDSFVLTSSRRQPEQLRVTLRAFFSLSRSSLRPKMAPSLPPAAPTSTLAAPAANTSKRDYLIELEGAAQKRWAAEKLFQTDSPYSDGSEPTPKEDFYANAAALREKRPKWFGTFPYPVSRARPTPYNCTRGGRGVGRLPLEGARQGRDRVSWEQGLTLSFFLALPMPPLHPSIRHSPYLHIPFYST